MFVNRIYLYDDGKITFIFNSGREPVEVDAELLDKIDNENKEAESSYLEQNASPLENAYFQIKKGA